MTSPRWLSARELSRGYAAGELSPVEATADVLAGIDEHDPAINAFCLVDPDSALTAARASAQRHADGTPIGPLDGVPVTIKDLLYTAGWPTLRGSMLIDPDSSEWTEDSPAVARLREAGAVLVGKVTSPEFGWKGVTDSPRTGVTRNPWDHSRTSGGSSGGSAASLAAGLGALSVGTDGGGSIRIPAAFCGVVGFKPTHGRVPIYPASPFGTLAHVGPMARTVGDVAEMLTVISGSDARDWWALPAATEDFSSAAQRFAGGSLSGLRVAYSSDMGYGTTDPAVRERFLASIAAAADLGATVEEVDLEMSDPVWAYHVLWFSGAATVVDSYGPGALERIDPNLAAALDRHRDFSAADYIAATAVRMDLGRRMGLFHETHDILLTPSMPTVAIEAGRDSPEGADPDWTSWTPYTYPFNLTGQPAITVPNGLVDGLPTGLQIVGPRHSDALVLAVAAAVEAVTAVPTLRERVSA
ncbi:amidase [Williamsia sp.]|uniref:amidase n=1 Tax=Williamsia sp. TaxID=1872085 RepID=UPI001A22F340|nr:amidase [Williamsia sp.]MBJ7289666.1 amidase [Williamsia sp.]